MRMVFWTILMVISTLSASAQDRLETIKETIERQMSAFQVDDFAAAFEYASPNIQRLFGDPETFGMMVKRGYPMVSRQADVTFLRLRLQQGSTVQRILVTDENGAVFALDYHMINTENGWRINGVDLLANSGLAA